VIFSICVILPLLIQKQTKEICHLRDQIKTLKALIQKQGLAPTGTEVKEVVVAIAPEQPVSLPDGTNSVPTVNVPNVMQPVPILPVSEVTPQVQALLAERAKFQSFNSVSDPMTETVQMVPAGKMLQFTQNGNGYPTTPNFQPRNFTVGGY